MVLADMSYNPGSTVNYTYGTAAWRAVDGTNLTFSFTPLTATTIVTLEACAGPYATTAAAQSFLWNIFPHGNTTSQISDNVAASQTPGGSVALGASVLTRTRCSFRFGTTPGTPMTVDWCFYANGGTWWIQVGANATPYSGPAVMTAYAD
jgi:hypothetical protein